MTSAGGREWSYRISSGSRSRVMFGPGIWNCSLMSCTAAATLHVRARWGAEPERLAVTRGPREALGD